MLASPLSLTMGPKVEQDLSLEAIEQPGPAVELALPLVSIEKLCPG